MISRERLLAIPDLILAGRIDQMEDLNQYGQALSAFVENFPKEEKKLKAALESKDYGGISQCLEDLCPLLESIYADNIAAGCRNYAENLGSASYQEVEAYVTHLLANVAELSIDIQMTQYSEEPKPQEKKAPAAPARKAGGTKTILAVDDTSIFLSTLKTYMRGTPYKLICVNSSADALRYLKDHRPDMFILDIEMPVMNGYELAEKIRGDGQEAPILFLTGNSTKEYVLKAIEAGAADFIVKPINKTHLLDWIKKYI